MVIKCDSPRCQHEVQAEIALEGSGWLHIGFMAGDASFHVCSAQCARDVLTLISLDAENA